MTAATGACERFWYIRVRYLVLLCHKNLDRFGVDLVGVQILTRGGGAWVSYPARAAANHGSWPMSRRSRQRSATPIARRRSAPIARDCCCPASARAWNRWPRACSRGGARAGGASVAASLRGKVRLVRRRGSCGGACPCPTHHRTARADPGVHH